jgi:hypothetical protein
VEDVDSWGFFAWLQCKLILLGHMKPIKELLEVIQ